MTVYTCMFEIDSSFSIRANDDLELSSATVQSEDGIPCRTTDWYMFQLGYLHPVYNFHTRSSHKCPQRFLVHSHPDRPRIERTRRLQDCLHCSCLNFAVRILDATKSFEFR
jgi:hypothetical protein